MKRKFFQGTTCLTRTIRISGCVMAGIANLQAEAADEGEIPGNWVELGVGGAFVDGNKAAFQKHAAQNGDFYGGIRSMHYSLESGDVTWTLDGHLLFGNEDYDITLGAQKEGLGYVKGGYHQFRSWYDGSGGSVPGVAGTWFQLYDDILRVDRGDVWVEAGLRKDELPEITLGYSHQWRQGNKDSTHWGQSAPGYAIVPTLSDLDEQRDTFTLDLADTYGNTDVDLGFVYEKASNDNRRLMRRQPGTTSSSGGIPNNRTINNHETYDYDLFSARASTESRLNEQMLLSFGYYFTTLDTDTGGERTSVDYLGINRPTSDHAYTALIGGAQFKQHVANANFWWNPVKDLVVVPSVRLESSDVEALSNFQEGGLQRDSSDLTNDRISEEIEVRYTGVNNLVLYTKCNFDQGDEDTLFRDVEGDLKLKSGNLDQQKYSVGANWYPLQGVSVSPQYYHRIYDVDYDNRYNPAVGNAFDAQIASYGSQTDDVNLRVSWRALPNLTLVSRYDYQQVSIDNGGISGTGAVMATVESGDVTRHILSQSATWTPFEQAWVQGSISLVGSETDTPANQKAPYRLSDFDNDCIVSNLTMGYSLDKRTDLQFGYTFYTADNRTITLDAAKSVGSTPFGADAEEHVFSVMVNRRIQDNMIWNMGYGYYTSNDGNSGGRNDFNAHMLSSGLQIRF